MTCWNRSPASSHFELELENHPVDDEAFFSALARYSSACDLPILSCTIQYRLLLITSPGWNGDALAVGGWVAKHWMIRE